MLLADLYMYNTPIAGLNTGLSRYETLCLKLSAAWSGLYSLYKQAIFCWSVHSTRASVRLGRWPLSPLPSLSRLSVRQSLIGPSVCRHGRRFSVNLKEIAEKCMQSTRRGYRLRSCLAQSPRSLLPPTTGRPAFRRTDEQAGGQDCGDVVTG